MNSIQKYFITEDTSDWKQSDEKDSQECPWFSWIYEESLFDQWSTAATRTEPVFFITLTDIPGYFISYQQSNRMKKKGNLSVFEWKKVENSSTHIISDKF